MKAMFRCSFTKCTGCPPGSYIAWTDDDLLFREPQHSKLEGVQVWHNNLEELARRMDDLGFQLVDPELMLPDGL